MDIKTLTDFFMWCTIIDVSLLTLAILIFILAPDFVFRLQSRWFPISKESFNVLSYAFIGTFKIFILVFNIVPYVALLIIG